MTDDVAVLPPSLAIPPTQELSDPITMRWPAALLARADAEAARLGVNRSVVMRMAVTEGLPAIERLGR